MLYKKKKDFVFREKFKKLEKFKKIILFLQRNSVVVKSCSKFKFLIMRKKYYYSKYSKAKIVRRCILTNRNRAISRPYNISRIILRDMLQSSIVPGYFKAVW